MQTFLSGADGLHRSRGRIRSAGLRPVQLEERAEGTFGVDVAGVYQERNIRRDGVEVLGYDTRTVERPRHGDAGARADRLRAVPAGARAQGRQLRRAVRSRPTASTSTSTGLYSKFDADNINQNFLAWGSRAIDNGGTLTNATIRGRHSGGRHDLVARTTARRTSASCTTRSTASPRRKRARSTSTSTGSPADGWTLHFKVGYTDAEGNTDSAAVRRVRRAGDVHLRPARQGAAGPASRTSIRPIRTTCSSSSARCTRS